MQGFSSGETTTGPDEHIGDPFDEQVEFDPLTVEMAVGCKAYMHIKNHVCNFRCL